MTSLTDKGLAGQVFFECYTWPGGPRLNRLYPKFPLKFVPILLRYAAFGGILAGCYGSLHDQITYSISPEYFTRFKFFQFHYLNFGLSDRVFVAEVGFLAASPVGFFAGWFLARTTVPKLTPMLSRAYILRGFSILFIFAIIGAIIGYPLGNSPKFFSNYSNWLDMGDKLGIRDLPRFVSVAYIHNGGYIGGLIGLIVALCYARRGVKRHSSSPLK